MKIIYSASCSFKNGQFFFFTSKSSKTYKPVALLGMKIHHAYFIIAFLNDSSMFHY